VTVNHTTYQSIIDCLTIRDKDKDLRDKIHSITATEKKSDSHCQQQQQLLDLTQQVLPI
jgi:hypothetical protein